MEKKSCNTKTQNLLSLSVFPQSGDHGKTFFSKFFLLAVDFFDPGDTRRAKKRILKN